MNDINGKALSATILVALAVLAGCFSLTPQPRAEDAFESFECNALMEQLENKEGFTVQELAEKTIPFLVDGKECVSRECLEEYEPVDGTVEGFLNANVTPHSIQAEVFEAAIPGAPVEGYGTKVIIEPGRKFGYVKVRYEEEGGQKTMNVGSPYRMTIESVDENLAIASTNETELLFDANTAGITKFLVYAKKLRITGGDDDGNFETGVSTQIEGVDENQVFSKSVTLNNVLRAEVVSGHHEVLRSEKYSSNEFTKVIGKISIDKGDASLTTGVSIKGRLVLDGNILSGTASDVFLGEKPLIGPSLLATSPKSVCVKTRPGSKFSVNIDLNEVGGSAKAYDAKAYLFYEGSSVSLNGGLPGSVQEIQGVKALREFGDLQEKGGARVSLFVNGPTQTQKGAVYIRCDNCTSKVIPFVVEVSS
ncbi:MAG TPA: hypothetical protein VJA40_03265 [archaeon]|nr:hypothetical protein [archaeon]